MGKGWSVSTRRRRYAYEFMISSMWDGKSSNLSAKARMRRPESLPQSSGAKKHRQFSGALDRRALAGGHLHAPLVCGHVTDGQGPIASLLPHPGIDGTWADGIDGYRSVGQLQGQVLCEVDDGYFGRVVSRGIRSADSQRHVDDTAAAPLQHRRDNGVAAVEYSLRWTAIVRAQSAVALSHTQPTGPMLRALFTIMSMAPKCSSVMRTAFSTCPNSDTLAVIVMTSVPYCPETSWAVSSSSAAVRAESASRAPSAA